MLTLMTTWAIIVLPIRPTGGRPGPSCQEIHHPSVESTRPTMNPARNPKLVDRRGSVAPREAIAAATAHSKNEIGASLEYRNFSRRERNEPAVSNAITAIAPPSTPGTNVDMWPLPQALARIEFIVSSAPAKPAQPSPFAPARSRPSPDQRRHSRASALPAGCTVRTPESAAASLPCVRAFAG
jgi:hypothetical protein